VQRAGRIVEAMSGLAKGFTPNWFAVTMGTGVLALALEQLPLDIAGRHELARGLWLFNVCVFGVCTVLYGLHWMLHPIEARNTLHHPTQSLFLGTIPMGLATILNGILKFATAEWGEAAVHLAVVLWYVDVGLSLICAWLVPYSMFTRQKHVLADMTAMWLLPLVAAEVAAASGALLLQHLPADTHAQHILIASYALWGLSVLPAMGVLAILFLRMALHKLPPREMAATSWLSLGPIGTGALSLLLLGDGAPRVLGNTSFANIAEVAHGVGILAGGALWGTGVWWLGLALLVTVRYLREGMPFTLGWWGFTFPLGVFSLATLALFRDTQLALFKISGSALVVLLAAIWCVVAGRTAACLWTMLRCFSTKRAATRLA